ncbi:MAG: enoyl-CoA hydratase/isomerase family protein, partial [Lachnospiraceae bacterium]|nr:enoyl-CoA hydratase/isomerase family protein [Lachnospiraceae bacterium]
MEFTTIQIGIEKNVVRIALNRPDKHNAMNITMIRELTEAIEWIDNRDDFRVIDIFGNGKSFCSGADFNYMK